MNIHGYVLGEHGDTSFPAWSLTTIGGVNLVDYCPSCGKSCDTENLYTGAQEYVRSAANKIIQAKGATYYAIGQAASVIIQAILRNERRILPISTVRTDFRASRRQRSASPPSWGRPELSRC